METQEFSNSSSIIISSPSSSDADPNSWAPLADVEALRLLSDNLAAAFRSPDFVPFTDAVISVGPDEVGVHRCVLSARSPFLKGIFSKKAKEKGEGNPTKLELKDLVKDFEVGFDALVGVLGYLYSGKVGPLPKGVCVCVDEECGHVGCRPAVDFMVEVMYMAFVFQIHELVSLFQVWKRLGFYVLLGVLDLL